VNGELTTPESQVNYFIYDCKVGVCKQTSGYIVSSDDVIVFVRDESADNQLLYSSSSDVAGCKNDSTDNEVGMVTSTLDGVCYEHGVGIKFTDGEDVDIRYIYLKGKAAKKTPFADRRNSVVVKRNVKYIVRDQFYSAGTVYI